MANSWEKVHSFLDTMDIQDLHSPFPSSSSSLSHQSSSNRSRQPLTIGSRSWCVGEKTARQIMSVIQPNENSEDRRKEIIEYLQTLIKDAFGITVFPLGSVPLKTYLPHGDIDLTAVYHYSSSQDIATEICSLLNNKEKNNTSVQVKDVICVPAQVRVVKCTVGGICVDISFNQKTGLCALYFLEQVDRFIGRDHLFKRSVILIKAWCYYESRILGGFHGLISTYALETMVLHVVNLFHSSLQCPLAVLYKFLEYYSTFDWSSYCVGINGLVLKSSLPEIVVQPPLESDDLLLTDAFLRRSREAILSSMGVVGANTSSFPVKFLNILDPLRDDNNLGRSVSKGNFFRIRSALSYGAEKLGEILMLPLENIKNGLEKFFKDTLERNGKGRREDIIVPVPTYRSEISDDSSRHDHLFSGINYGLWFNDYSVMYTAESKTSEHRKVRNNRWAETGHTVQFDQRAYHNFNKSHGVTSFSTSKAAPAKEKSKSRGTGTFIPHIKHLLQRNMVLERSEVERESWRKRVNAKEHETGKEVDIVDSPACTLRSAYEAENIDAFSYSIEEFPVLPGSKRIPIKASPFLGFSESSASLDDSLELDSFKHSSPRSFLSEVGKQSDSDVSSIVEDQESSKSEEKSGVPLQRLQLKDDLQFPPLSRAPEPVISLNRKEFPPLRSCLKSHRSPKSRKDLKGV